MNLLISQRVLIDKHGEKNDSLERAYTKYFNSLGINLIPVSAFIKNLDDFLNSVKCDGLIVTGGGDVSPEFNLNNKANPDNINYSEERQSLEIKLIEKMISEKKPVLGICYGMQLLNCYFGGKVFFDFHKDKESFRQPGKSHKILIDEYKKMSGEFEVNHYHNTVVKKDTLANELKAFAYDSEHAIVEGLIHKKYKIFGVQWHPERPSPDIDFNLNLIKTFLFSSE